tara:strand:+ start:5352 stop:6116 length:765 start_codon:yes stop_codon:yes gene_type:complete
MRIFLISFLAIPFMALSSQLRMEAADINCNSPVWRNRKPCEGKTKKEKSPYGSWFPFGFNKKGKAVNWAQLLSYKELNDNSFRLISKFTYPDQEKKEGKLDINCLNKDYYIRPKGVMSQKSTWAKIPKNSGVETLAKYFCKNTSARGFWGYTKNTSYLWDIPIPVERADAVTGEWIQHSDGLGWYNTEILPRTNSIVYSYFSTKTGKYSWINTSCSENLSSILYKPNNRVSGSWLGPQPGRRRGISLAVKDRFC